MIVNEWEPYFTAHYGHVFPDTYLCLDTEYTGGDERTDFVMEIGHVMVEDRQVVDQLNIVLDWSVHPGVDVELLRYKLNNIQSIMGLDWRVTWDVMKEEGIAPFKALRFYHKFFKAWNKRDLPYVAHNGRVAEERMLRGAFNRYLNRSFVIGDNQLWDTGAIFKATALLESSDLSHSSHHWKCHPKHSDTMKEYFNRVLGVRAKGIRWKLKLCLEQYELLDQLQDDHRYHQAVYDAYCSYLLMEAYREKVTRCNAGEELEEQSVDIVDEWENELEDEFPEFVEVPRQPLEEKTREVVRTTATTVLPPAPAFTRSSKVSKEDLKERLKSSPKPEAEKQKPLQPVRGRKRGQRVI